MSDSGRISEENQTSNRDSVEAQDFLRSLQKQGTIRKRRAKKKTTFFDNFFNGRFNFQEKPKPEKQNPLKPKFSLVRKGKDDGKPLASPPFLTFNSTLLDKDIKLGNLREKFYQNAGGNLDTEEFEIIAKEIQNEAFFNQAADVASESKTSRVSSIFSLEKIQSMASNCRDLSSSKEASETAFHGFLAMMLSRRKDKEALVHLEKAFEKLGSLKQIKVPFNSVKLLKTAISALKDRLDVLRNGKSEIYSPLEFSSQEAFDEYAKQASQDIQHLIKSNEKRLAKLKRKKIYSPRGIFPVSMYSWIVGSNHSENTYTSDSKQISNSPTLSERDAHFQYMLLFLILLSYDNQDDDLRVESFFLSSLEMNVSRLRDSTLAKLSENSHVVLHAFRSVYLISNQFSRLLSLQAFVSQGKSSDVFWKSLLSIKNSLNDKSHPLTKSEVSRSADLLQIAVDWGCACLKNYQFAFRSNLKGLIAMEYCLKFLDLNSEKLANIASLTATQGYQVIKNESKHNVPVSGTRDQLSYIEKKALDSLGCTIDSPKHLIVLLKTLEAEVRKDSIFFMIRQNENSRALEFARRVSDYYLAFAMTDSQLLLRALVDQLEEEKQSPRSNVGSPSEKHTVSPKQFSDMINRVSTMYTFGVSKTPAEVPSYHFDGTILLIYNEIKNVYTALKSFVGENYKLPEIHPQVWFEPFVDQWIDKQRFEFFDNGRIARTIDLDNFHPSGNSSGASLGSSSLLDLFQFMYLMAECFKKLPYCADQALNFSRVLSDIIQDYMKRIADMLREDLKKEAMLDIWGLRPKKNGPGPCKETISFELAVPRELITRLNNLQLCRKHLLDLLLHIDLEKAYGNVPIISVDTVATIKLRDVEVDFSLDYDTELPSGLLLEDAFKQLDGILFEVESSIALGVSLILHFHVLLIFNFYIVT